MLVHSGPDVFRTATPTKPGGRTGLYSMFVFCCDSNRCDKYCDDTANPIQQSHHYLSMCSNHGVWSAQYITLPGTDSGCLIQRQTDY